ncbi:MAG: NFACT RNA binding domain-containing protein [Firmicutes bacterium]|nr:NFACT RNA binding domain-containing protein [Bacillota bacterium]
MPFDALLMRAIEARWQRDVVGAACVKSLAGPDRVLWMMKRDHMHFQILVVLDPGLKRLHRTSDTRVADPRPVPWLERLTPFTITEISVPPLERVMYLTIQHRDEWDALHHGTLVVELAGHLTNLIWLDDEGRVVEAWRKVPPGRPGRAIWPKEPYAPPPSRQPANALSDPRAWPPLARTWVEDGGSWEKLRQDFAEGFLGPAFQWLTDRGEPDLWVYPLLGAEAQPVDDLERGLDRVFRQRETARWERELRQQLLAQIDRRDAILREKLAQAENDLREDWRQYQRLGDLWLAYQYAFSPSPEPASLTVPDEEGQLVTLTLNPGESPLERAQAAYRQHKKVKARHQALSQLIPAYRAELADLAALRRTALDPHPLSWYRDALKRQVRAAGNEAGAGPFRRFQSLNGVEILVGRNREENQELTFRTAKPDDLWFHAKQVPGSHVILRCGRTNPDLQDILDAATLAVFFSSAHASSHVPVDYTRRKYVRKRPHAEPGAVLYRMEKTLYITPEPDRLQRLGAIREKLVQG